MSIYRNRGDIKDFSCYFGKVIFTSLFNKPYWFLLKTSIVHLFTVVLLNRSLEVPSSEPEASTIRPNQLTIFFGGKVRVFDGIPADKVGTLDHILLRVFSVKLRLQVLIHCEPFSYRFKKSSVLLLLLLNPLRQRTLRTPVLSLLQH